MAYQSHESRILSGGINLVPPGDLIDDRDALSLSNFRVDSQGNIKSRNGHSSLGTGMGNVHSITKSDTNRYNGGGTALYRNFSSADTGYDGNPLGFASTKGYLCVMNKSRQRRVNASGSFQWIPTAPSSAPTVSVGAELATTVETFESTAGFTASTGATLAADSADFKQGSNSLKVSFTDAGTYTVSKTSALNLNSVGGQTGSDNDKHRIWVKVTDWRQIESVRIIVNVASSVTYDTEIYTAEISRRKIRKVKGAWTLFEIRRAQSVMDILSVDPNQTDLLRDIINPRLQDRELINFGDLPANAQAAISREALVFYREGTDTTRTWANVTGIRLEIEARGATDVWFDGWEVFGSVSGTVEGRDIQYYYTYVTSDGIESNPSPASTATRFNRRSATVALVASGDSQVSGIHVYRTGGTLGAVLRVTSTPEANTNHNYVDTSDDDDLTNLNTKIETDNDAPPAAAGLIGPFLGRLIAFNSTANPNRFWWSKLNKFGFPGSASSIGQWADIGPAGEVIQAATMQNHVVTFYKSSSIWRLVGDPDDTEGRVEKTRSTIGALGPNAVCVGDNGDFFASSEGVFFFNGDVPTKISQKIDPLFKGQTVTLASGITKAPISTKANTALGFINGRLYVSYTSSGSTNNETIVLNLETGDWDEDTRGFSSFYNDAGTPLAGTPGGAVVQIETGTTDAGNAIPVIYHSKYIDCGLADSLKTFEDIVIEHNTGGATFTLAVYKDNGTSVTVTPSTFSSSSRTKSTFQLDTEGKGIQALNLSFRITGNTSAEASIFGRWLHWYPEARSASSFDTDENLLGSPQVKVIRQLKFDIDNASDATARIYTDLPGNAMSERESVTITGAASGRRMISKMLSSQRNAYLGRAVIDGSAFKLYGLYAEVKDVGDYVLASELWDSDAVNWGTQKPKALRSLRVELENSADVTLTIYSDLPGGVLTSRETKTITANSNRRVVEVPLTTERQGFLYRITASSTADWILYDVQAEVKEIGSYVLSSKTYNSDPLDFGTKKAKRMRALQIEIENSADVTLLVKSDLPGGTLATRDTLVIAANSTRRIVNIPLGAEREGYLFQFQASSTADFIIYSIQPEIIEIGTYVAGSSSKIWDSGIIDWGTERIKLIKEIEVDLISSATVTLNLLTDQPGGVVTSRITKTIASTSSVRKTAKIRLEDGYKGRLYQFKLSTVSTDFTVEAVRALVKLVGEPGATSWIWVDLLIERTSQGVWGWVSAPLEETEKGIWRWAGLPVVRTGSNAWRWHSFSVDALAAAATN